MHQFLSIVGLVIKITVQQEGKFDKNGRTKEFFSLRMIDGSVD